MPFSFEPYRSPFTNSIADTILRRGDIAAQAAARSGAIWGGAVQGVGQAVSGAIQQATDPRAQLEREQLAQVQRTKQFTGIVNGIVANLTQQNPDGSRTLDRAKLQQQFAAANVPPELQATVFKSLDDVDSSIAKFQTAKTDHLADLAHSVLQAGGTPDALAYGIALAKANGLVTDDQVTPIVQAAANGADLKPILTQIRGLSEKYKDVAKPVVVPEGGSLVSPATGEVITKGTPKPPTAAELAFQLSDPDPAVRDRAKKAIEALHPPPKRTDAEMALDAYAKSLGLQKAEDLSDAQRQDYAKRQATITSNQAFEQHKRERQYDIANPIPEKKKSQDALEQEYRTVLARGLSSRSGGLGLEDAKVQQANHLLALMDQSFDPKTGVYNIPKVQYEELALGLARLVSPGGTVGEGMKNDLVQATAEGDLLKVATYLTGHPFNGSTQDVFKMLRESIERQGKVALDNREGEMRYLRGLAPTDLEEGRRLALEANSLNPLRQSRMAVNEKGEKRLFVSTDGGKTWK